MKHNHSGFSLTELVFVIVVFGIVASLGSQIISRLYLSQIMQRASYRLNVDSDILIDQISNRLHYAIKETIVTKTDGHTGSLELLQWVSSDFDGFHAIHSNSDRAPGWSGRIDLNTSADKHLYSLGSNLGLEERLISNLSITPKPIALFSHTSGNRYDVNHYDKDKATFYLNQELDPSEYGYILAWRSYALELVDGVLYLYYDLLPFKNAHLSGAKVVLGKNISSFFFSRNAIGCEIKICLERRIATSDKIEICKSRQILW